MLKSFHFLCVFTKYLIFKNTLLNFTSNSHRAGPSQPCGLGRGALRVEPPVRRNTSRARQLHSQLPDEAEDNGAVRDVRERRLAKFRQNVARFRLYRLRFLQENMRFAAFFKIYQILKLKFLKFGNILQILRHLQFFC